MTEPIAEIALVRMAQAASSRRAAPDGGADAGGTTERQRLFADVLGGLLESGPSAKSPSLVKSASAPGASGPDDSSLAMSGLGDASASKSLMMSILLRRFADSKPDLAHGTLSRSTAAPAASTVSRAPFAESGGLAGMARQVAREHGLDPALLAGVASVESGWNPRAESPAGAKGLMQLMDGTARQLGVTDPFDPAQSLRGGAQYLRDLLNRYGGDQRLALAAYNAGPGSVDRFGGIPPYPETQHYVAAVLDAAAEIRSQG